MYLCFMLLGLCVFITRGRKAQESRFRLCFVVVVVIIIIIIIIIIITIIIIIIIVIIIIIIIICVFCAPNFLLGYKA